MNSASRNAKPRVLFFGRAGCRATTQALSHLHALGFAVEAVMSRARGEELPGVTRTWEGDYIFCFRSFFVLPIALIGRARHAAINFHGGPPEYPGSGCLNFALYDGADTYGVTAHFMNEKIDNGRIIACRRFPVFAEDTVDSLLARTHGHLLDLFLELTAAIAGEGVDAVNRKAAASAHEKWAGRARKLSELDKLQEIDVNAPESEVRRIIRATYTEAFPPKIVLHGFEFVLKNPYNDAPRPPAAADDRRMRQGQSERRREA